METIRIPVGAPVTFTALRRLNPDARIEELADAIGQLPRQLQDEAWETLRLRIELSGQAEAGE